MALGDLFKRKSPEQKFWDWFSIHEERYFQALTTSEDLEPLFDDLTNELHKVHNGITFEFSQKTHNGKLEFIISADGIRDRVPAVISLCAVAPQFRRWTIIAFRQRKDNFEVRWPNGSLKGEDIFFDFTKSNNLIHANLKIRDYDSAHVLGVFILIDMLLGEYDAITYLGQLSFEKLEPNEELTLLPFIELRALVDKLKQQIH